MTKLNNAVKTGICEGDAKWFIDEDSKPVKLSEKPLQSHSTTA